jgi:SH3-like domain-containing protein
MQKMSGGRSFAWLRAAARGGRWNGARALCLSGCLVLASGCSHLRPGPPTEYVYVSAKQQALRDRVAAVSNRTGMVQNGDRLKVLERGRRFLRVQTEKGEIGWIEERTVVGQDVYDEFAALDKQHDHDPAVATGVVRDEVYVHLTPGRATEKFFRLAEGDKLSLIQRATLPKGGGLKAGPLKNAKQAAIPGAATGIAPASKTASPTAKTIATTTPATPGASTTPAATAAAPASATAASAAPGEPPVPPPMEDWWLVRDGKGRVGWVLSRMMDVDAPDALSRYAEGQRIVGAYVLATVNDPDAPGDNKNVPEYVTVLSPYKSGLPYDFDQVRIFTWNPRMHRYETAFRERNIEGYLPVTLKMLTDPSGKLANATTPMPGFQYKVLSATAPPVVPDPDTGAIVPGQLITKSYRLEGNIVRRLLAPGEVAPDEAHPDPEQEKAKDAKKAKGKRRR